MKMNKRLIALNLCLLLLISAFAFGVSASSQPAYSISVDGASFSSTEDAFGDGWRYYHAESKLVLDGYNGTTIKASGDLIIYAKNDSFIHGTSSGVYSTESCGIVVNGTLDLNVEGDLTINGAAPGTSKGGEGIVAAKAIIKSDYGTNLNIFGGNKSFAIKANELVLSTKNLTAKGGIGSSAIYFSSNFEVLEGASATVISGSDEKYAITHLKNATHSFDDDVIVSFFDNSTRVVFESKSAFQYGDINEDGDVNSNDIVLLAQIIAKWNVDVSSKGLAAADVVKDGVLDSADAVLLAQFIAKWDVTLGQ